MEIRPPHERGVGQPLIGSNHMHLMACREGDETSVLVECNSDRVFAAIEGRDVMAFVSECLQSIVARVGDDDSTLIIDAYSMRIHKLTWLIALGAELEQERAIDRRQYLHPITVALSDDDSMSIVIDRNSGWEEELAWLKAILADRVEGRQVARCQ